MLTEKPPCLVEIVRLHLNATGLSAGSIRYLKMEIEADRFLLDRQIIAAHLMSSAFFAAQFKFAILIFARRDYGVFSALKGPSSPGKPG